jgi:hypothetical protein
VSSAAGIHFWQLLVLAIVAAVPGTVAAIAALKAHSVGRSNATKLERGESKLEAINHAVNGADPADATIRENVQTLIRRRGLNRWRARSERV